MKTVSLQSIYRSQCRAIKAIFEEAPSPKKILIVPIDYAKQKHVALICDGNGDTLKKAFPVENSSEGLAFLLSEVQATARRRKIPRKHIIFGGEDEPAYVENFLRALRGKEFLAVRVNAWEASQLRKNALASTDQLDLIGIAKALLSRQAWEIDQSQENSLFRQLRDLARTRHDFVCQQTAVSNRVHALADRLCPGFLNSSKSGITPFTAVSLTLMKDRFSAPQLARRRHGSLADLFRRNKVHHPEESAAKLLDLAKGSLPPDPGMIACYQHSLRCSVELFECLKRNALDLEQQCALLLAQTPYAMLTSIPGIGFVLAAGVGGELGQPSKLGGTDSLCAYSGVVPRTHQTGGPDKAANQLSTSPRCNRFLKSWVVQSAQKLALYGPPDWRDRVARWQAAGQHAPFAGARRYLRLLRTLVRYEVPYLPPEARRTGAPPEVKAAAAEETFRVLVSKWRKIPGWQQIVFSEDRPLGRWRRVAMEMHRAHLPLPDDRNR